MAIGWEPLLGDVAKWATDVALHYAVILGRLAEEAEAVSHDEAEALGLGMGAEDMEGLSPEAINALGEQFGAQAVALTASRFRQDAPDQEWLLNELKRFSYHIADLRQVEKLTPTEVDKPPGRRGPARLT